VLCDTVKDFITKISQVTLMQGDEDFSSKCHLLKTKLEHLLLMLKEEQSEVDLVAEAVRCLLNSDLLLRCSQIYGAHYDFQLTSANYQGPAISTNEKQTLEIHEKSMPKSPKPKKVICVTSMDRAKFRKMSKYLNL